MRLEELIALLRESNTFTEVNKKREDIAEFLPVVARMFDYDQNNPYHPYDLWEHSVRTALEIPKDNQDDMLFLAALLHDIGKPDCRCRGKKADDTASHYYGHSKISKKIVEESVISCLDLSQNEKERLLYYVECHDDHVGLRPRNIRKQYDRVPYEVFKNLLLLEMADTITHDMSKPLMQERYSICKELYEGKGQELYLWLAEEAEKLGHAKVRNK